jgi:hypothetical protein
MLGTYTRVFDDDEVLKLLHSSVKSAGGQIAFSKRTGVERSHLNMVLNGKRRLSPSIIDVTQSPRCLCASRAAPQCPRR